MGYADFAKKHYPLKHPVGSWRVIREKVTAARKRQRDTVSGFHRGDRVQHMDFNLGGLIQGTIVSLRGEFMWVRWADNSQSRVFCRNYRRI